MAGDLRRSLTLVDGLEYGGWRKTSASLEELMNQLAEERLHQLYLAKAYKEPLLTLELEGSSQEYNFTDMKDHPSNCDLLTSPNIGSLPRLLIQIALDLDQPSGESVHKYTREEYSEPSEYTQATALRLPLSSNSTTSSRNLNLGIRIIEQARSNFIMPSKRYGTEGFITKTFFGQTDYKTFGWVDKFDRHLTRVLELIGQSSKSPVIRSMFSEVEIDKAFPQLEGHLNDTSIRVWDVTEQMGTNPLALAFTECTKFIQGLDSTNARFSVNMTTSLLPDGTPSSREIFEQEERFELTRIASLLKSVPLCWIPITVFLRRYYILIRMCYRKKRRDQTQRLLVLVSEDEDIRTRVAGTATERVQLVNTWIQTFKEERLVDFSNDAVTVNGTTVRLTARVLTRLDTLWSQILVCRITRFQALIRGHKTRDAVDKLKRARNMMHMLQAGVNKAKQQHWNYFHPVVFPSIFNGEEFLAKVTDYLTACEECDGYAKWIVPPGEWEALRVFNSQVLEHASLLCECERMLTRQETQLQPINSLLAQVSAEGLQGDAITMLTLRAQKLKTEELWRKKILRALKRNDLQAAAATLEQIKAHRNPGDIISPHLNHLVSEFQKRSAHLTSSFFTEASVESEREGSKTASPSKTRTLMTSEKSGVRSPLRRMMAPNKMSVDPRLTNYVAGRLVGGKFVPVGWEKSATSTMTGQ
eukprot:Blabericola_migrator_1__458@NODE_110_length_13983_cov_82_900618_g98_i0_p2_GENE_NODE_110_length_13983_cov_82_900618_g98_i0NODE_110_length_13983_cov_82_900618_g98_i0_p2_ORF_typecomplete_len700_score113_90Myosin_head/PF00063_21/1e06_NODE_110_length_13983_cov_82_900618_g98_i011993298